jgi:hypothetical protein
VRGCGEVCAESESHWGPAEPRLERVMARCEGGVWASEGDGVHTSGRVGVALRWARIRVRPRTLARSLRRAYTPPSSRGVAGRLTRMRMRVALSLFFGAELIYFFEFVYSVLFCGASCVRSGLELVSGLVLELRVRVRISALGTSRIEPASPSMSLTGRRRGVHTSLGSVSCAHSTCRRMRMRRVVLFSWSFFISYFFLVALAFGGARARLVACVLDYIGRTASGA